MDWNHPILSEITHLPIAIRCNNLGDDIQSIALKRLLNHDIGYVDRDALQRWSPSNVVPLCGWFGWGRFPTPARVLIFGFHCCPKMRISLFENRKWFAEQVKNQGFPAMCRDLSTRDFLRGLGIDAEFGGCVTLTFPEYGGRRHGTLAIDDLSQPGKPQLSQIIPELPKLGIDDRLKLAQQRIELMRTAELVETSRLHVALPCHAMKTPYRLKKTEDIQSRERFSGYGLISERVQI